MKSQPYNPSDPYQTGCIYGMPNEAYHAAVDKNGFPVVSNTKLWDFNKRPRMFQGKYVTKEVEDGPTEPKTTGSGSHALILETEESFNAQFTCLETELVWTGKTAKRESIVCMAETKGVPLTDDQIDELAAKKKSEIEQHIHSLPGKTILTKQQFDLLKILREQVHTDPHAGPLLDGIVPEVTFRSPQLELGYTVQCRFDGLNAEGCVASEGRAFGCDLKTIDSLGRWEKEKLKRGYYRSWPFYSKVQEISVGERIIHDWFFIVVEKQWPYSVVVKRPDDAQWDVGMKEITSDMKALAECIKTNHYPEPGEKGITWDTLPDWMLNDLPVKQGIQAGDVYVPVRDYESRLGWSTDGGLQ